MVTRPVIASIASVTRLSWRSVVVSRHWLKQAKTMIISGMGGCSLCRVGLGNPYSTLGSAALPHLRFWRRYWLEAMIYILDRFGWHNPPIETLKNDQNNLLTGRI